MPGSDACQKPIEQRYLRECGPACGGRGPRPEADAGAGPAASQAPRLIKYGSIRQRSAGAQVRRRSAVSGLSCP